MGRDGFRVLTVNRMPTILPLVILDSHLHVGSLRSLDVALDRDRPESRLCGDVGPFSIAGDQPAAGRDGHGERLRPQRQAAPSMRHGRSRVILHPAAWLAQVRASRLPQDLAERVPTEGGRRPCSGGGTPDAVA